MSHLLFEDVVADLNKAGLYVTLVQFATNEWHAGLAPKEHGQCRGYAKGATPQKALSAALEYSLKPKPKPGFVQDSVINNQFKVKGKVSVDDL